MRYIYIWLTRCSRPHETCIESTSGMLGMLLVVAIAELNLSYFGTGQRPILGHTVRYAVCRCRVRYAIMTIFGKTRFGSSDGLAGRRRDMFTWFLGRPQEPWRRPRRGLPHARLEQAGTAAEEAHEKVHLRAT